MGVVINKPVVSGGLDNSTPFLVPTYDSSGELVFAQAFHDASGEEVFNFEAKATAILPDTYDSYKNALSSAEGAEANPTLQAGWNSVVAGFDNLSRRVINLEETLQGYKLLPDA